MACIFIFFRVLLIIIMKKIILLFLILILLFLYFIYKASKGSVSPGVQSQKISTLSLASKEFNGELNIMTWNIAWLYGKGSEGDDDYKIQSQDFYQKKLKDFSQIFLDNHVDLAFLQEVDFDSDRSYHINELEALQKQIAFSFSIPVQSWDVAYMPFPYSPISRHWKKIISGGGILSRYKVSEGYNLILEKPDFFWAYKKFYLHRYFQVVQLNLSSNESYYIINVHLEAFDQKKREAEISQLIQMIKKLQKEKEVLILAGDFNCEYEECEMIAKELDFMKAPDKKLTTFPADNPHKKLDRIFVSRNWEINAFTRLETGTLSDHLPLFMKIKKLAARNH